jgi:diguanylate cyclase (GGDEF)-like protein/PAS domain S-box-containing protein
MLKRKAWWLLLAVMAPISGLYLVGPSALHSGFVFNAIGLGAAAAIVCGVRLHRPGTKWPWYLFAIGQAVFVVGDVLAYNYQRFFGSEIPYPSIADPFYLAVYPPLVLGILILIRRRNPGRDWASLIDSLIVATGLGLLSWIFLMAPYAHDSSLSTGTKLVSIAYPLMDTLVLAVAVRLAVGRGQRGPAYYLMISAVCSLLVTDAVYGWLLLHDGYTGGGLLDAGWIVFYLLWGAAALHPSMAAVSDATAPAVRLTRARLGMLAIVTAIAPVAQMITSSGNGGIDSVIIAGVAIVLFSLVILRMLGLVRTQEAAAQRERALREAGSSLVTATNQLDILRAAENAARTLAGPDAACHVFHAVERDGVTLFATTDDSTAAAVITVPLSAIPREVVSRLERRLVTTMSDGNVLMGGDEHRPAIIAPLISRGDLVGALVVAQGAGFAAATTAALEALSFQVGLALESATLTEDIHRTESEARFSSLIQHSSDVILVLDVDTTIKYVSPSVARVLGYPVDQLARRRLSELIDESDRPLVMNAIAGLAAGVAVTSKLLEFRIRSHDGTWLQAETFVTNLIETPAVGGLVMNLRDITERKQFEEQLTHQAFHDPVTGLANRALFRNRVEHALGRRREGHDSIAILFLDLDDFKTVNDTFGHLVGDELLRSIGARLAEALRAGDTAARLGGDEFAILLEDVDDDDLSAAGVAARLLEVVRAPFVIDGKDVFVQGSIGIAVASDDVDAAITVEDLLSNADIAMYRAKGNGKGDFAFFASEMRSTVVERLELRAELKSAIENEELTIAYQPIVSIDTGAITGLEALLRWKSPQRGNISPATFIPIAEETGLIVPLGKWVLDRACRDAVLLKRRHALPAGFVVSVNVSAWQLQRPEIVDEVRDALTASGLEPASLMLEITESMMMKNMELAVARLTDLREIGVKIALDDFGTGYSSLNHIRLLPINMLKIDKSFISDIHNDQDEETLTTTIVELARALSLVSIAEGVENSEQLAKLADLGCMYAQGYLFSPPVPLEALERLLEPGEATPLAA